MLRRKNTPEIANYISTCGTNKYCLPFTGNHYLQLTANASQLNNRGALRSNIVSPGSLKGRPVLHELAFSTLMKPHTKTGKSNEDERTIVPSIRCQYFIYGAGGC